MNTDQWNRKECSPSKTIQHIRSILHDIGIDPVITDYRQYKTGWASSRIEINGLYGIGSNGKGISQEYAMASAYAELMERLQGGTLLNQYFPNKNCKKHALETEHQQSIHEMETISDNTVDERNLWNSVIQDYPEYAITQRYFAVKSLKYINIPERIVSYLCGSNGLCAGNSYEEAYSQGLCEVFERYAHRKIFDGTPENESYFATIPAQYYNKTESYRLIKMIEEKGYICRIKDCTLGGIFPVVGVLIMDKTKKRYIFRLGSDIYFDLALQRAITEVFQGIDFGTEFKFSMQGVYSTGHASIFDYSNPEVGQVPSISSGTGILPFWLFMDRSFQNNLMSPFVFSQPTNKEAASLLTQIAIKNDMEIYIRDCGFLGFPTLRIFVPYVSDVFSFGTERTVNSIICLQEYRRLIKQRGSIHDQYCLLKDLLNYPTYSYNIAFSRLNGIIVSSNSSLQEECVYLYASALAILEKDYSSAEHFVRIHYRNMTYSNSHQLNDTILYIRAKKHGLDESDIRMLFSELEIDYGENELIQIYSSLAKTGQGIYCNDCSVCDRASICAYIRWNEIMEKLKKREEKYYTQESACFVSFLQESFVMKTW